MSRYSLPLMFSFVTVAFRRNGGPAENNHQTGMFCRQNTHSTIGPTKSRNLTSTLNNLSDTSGSFRIGSAHQIGRILEQYMLVIFA